MAAIGSFRTDLSTESNEEISIKKSPLSHLPPDCLPFEQFETKFSLAGASTEQSHPHTKQLSQTMQKDLVKGLELLLDADEAVAEGLERFLPTLEPAAAEIAERLEKGGRLFLVGSGSSGRVAIDLAAKCGLAYPKAKEQIRGIIAGGDSALIRAKEGFEDSERDGEIALEAFHLKPEDAVLLISASGSASFNVRCGHFAANNGSKVFYFYNSKEIPPRTQKLFERTNNPAVPLELDIGPQAIGGSTRLQGASIAEACLGALLETVFDSGHSGEHSVADMGHKIRKGTALVRKHLDEIAQLIRKETVIFSNPNSNFRRLRDETAQGYVTFAGLENTIREILIDATETSPTFSTNPIRREGESHLKKEEFSAYLIGQNESQAWKTLLGREPDLDTESFRIAKCGKCDDRQGKGNLCIGVAKISENSEIPAPLIAALNEAASKETETGLIAVSRGLIASTEKGVFVENVPSDPLGIVETLVLKQILNLISNGSMVLMNKVHGNRMIDVRASNGKLIDRCIRLVKEIWSETERPMKWSDRDLYHFITHANAYKKSAAEIGLYTPSVVKIVLALLHLEKEPGPESFQKAVDLLASEQERLDFLIPNTYTFCIDGGGTKTELQILDRQGRTIPFFKNGVAVDKIHAGPSNISVIKKDGVKSVLKDLFQNIQVNGENVEAVLHRSRIVAGMAGVSQPENKSAVASLFHELGIEKDQLILQNDGELALRLLQGNGIVLISGTGSVCFAEKNGVRHRVGGLGRILGDEGSGYQMGLKALQAALKEEHGYGPSTQLTVALRNHFGVKELKTLSVRINSGEMSPSEIASAAPLVFEKAAQKDAAALAILNRIAEDLREMVSTALKISSLSNCELHLWGGLFNSDFTDTLIKKIKEDSFVEWRNVKIVNRSSENVAVAFARGMSKN